MDTPRTVDDYRSGAVHESWMRICRFLLSDDEFRTLRIEIVDDHGKAVAESTVVGENDFGARVTIADEQLNVSLFEPRSVDEIAWQFYNDLQDFISESAFGWGQLRGPMWAWDEQSGPAPYEA